MPNEINYMFSISLARTIRKNAMPDLVVNNTISNINDYSVIITGLDSSRFKINDCFNREVNFNVSYVDCIKN